MQDRILRLFIGLAGLAYAVLAFGFTRRTAWAADLWPWPDTPLSYTFIGSIAAALAAASLWVAWSGRVAAIFGALLGLAAIHGLTTVYIGVLWRGGQGDLRNFALAAGLTTVIGLALVPAVLWRLRDGGDPGDRLEPLVRISTGVFALALCLAGAALVARFAAVFPWPLSRQSSTMFGIIFLGLSLVYAHVCLTGARGAAIVAMTGFLVYDLLLLPPFIGHFGRVAPDHWQSLVLYTGVLVYSALLALWFLTRRG